MAQSKTLKMLSVQQNLLNLFEVKKSNTPSSVHKQFDYEREQVLYLTRSVSHLKMSRFYDSMSANCYLMLDICWIEYWASKHKAEQDRYLYINVGHHCTSLPK